MFIKVVVGFRIGVRDPVIGEYMLDCDLSE